MRALHDRPGQSTHTVRARALGAGIVASILAAGLVSALPAPASIKAGTATKAPSTTAAGDVRVPSRRVDLTPPTFSHPTRITNPLFPISRLTQVIQLGHEGDETLKHEITLLDDTKVFRWRGQRVETVASQFVAYGDGRVLEVAVDYFAQADDGSVWYFGEYVDNYVDGVIDNHDGTWLAGRDGPAGMIMPTNPQVGDVYRPENIPRLVFEEVTVMAVDQTVDGPRGPVHGAIVVQERLTDGVLEDKVFAPHYGEFEARVPTEDELVTIAVAAPTDSLHRRAPRSLTSLTSAAERLFEDAASQPWSKLETSVERMLTTWDGYRGERPPLLESQMDDAFEAVRAAVDGRDRSDLGQAAIDVAHSGLDLHLQYREPEDVDEDRLDVWGDQIELDRAAGDAGAVAGDRAIVGALEARISDDDDD